MGQSRHCPGTEEPVGMPRPTVCNLASIVWNFKNGWHGNLLLKPETTEDEGAESHVGLNQVKIGFLVIRAYDFLVIN